jgi:hypothetical protein
MVYADRRIGHAIGFEGVKIVHTTPFMGIYALNHNPGLTACTEDTKDEPRARA